MNKYWIPAILIILGMFISTGWAQSDNRKKADLIANYKWMPLSKVEPGQEQLSVYVEGVFSKSHGEYIVLHGAKLQFRWNKVKYNKFNHKLDKNKSCVLIAGDLLNTKQHEWHFKVDQIIVLNETLRNFFRRRLETHADTPARLYDLSHIAQTLYKSVENQRIKEYLYHYSIKSMTLAVEADVSNVSGGNYDKRYALAKKLSDNFKLENNERHNAMRKLAFRLYRDCYRIKADQDLADMLRRLGGILDKKTGNYYLPEEKHKMMKKKKIGDRWVVEDKFYFEKFLEKFGDYTGPKVEKLPSSVHYMGGRKITTGMKVREVTKSLGWPRAVWRRSLSQVDFSQWKYEYYNRKGKAQTYYLQFVQERLAQVTQSKNERG